MQGGSTALESTQRLLRCEGDEKRRDGEEGEEGVRGEITAAGRRGVEWKADTKRGRERDGGREGGRRAVVRWSLRTMAAATIMRQVGVRAAFSTSALSVLSSMKLAAEMKAPVSSLAEIGAMRGSTIEATTTTRAAEIIRRARGETRRAFGAGAGKGETFEGVTIHEPEPWQQNLANGVMAAMW